ncbi:MAG: hypothetical protein NPIRA02_15400 [Nitrospirales bacterium]|nr:MAG: hypothetical protein NPIRA02_15400 [Nitrospirales bacterium]
MTITNAFGFWEFLSRDVAFLGGPHSPLLSWLGSLGILLFFLWHVRTLRREATSVRQGFVRIQPVLKALIHERGNVDRERFTQPLTGSSPRNPSHNPHQRIDCNDLDILDAEMEKEPMFYGLWAQYRTTLIVERVPWFMEPRIFSTTRAEHVFTQDALMANRINLPFYGQFPSLVTGMGLLMTFIALFIGLGKLHADGSQILGIQGLINGLAGKFLTSIVGLIAANLFTFIEKPMVSQLMTAHHEFLGLIDQLFPRKTMEQMLEHLTSIHGERDGTRAPAQHETLSGLSGNGLVGPTANLTSSIQSLKKLQEDEHLQTRQVLSDIPYVMRQELEAPLRELTDTIHDLTKMLKNVNTSLRPVDSTFTQQSHTEKIPLTSVKPTHDQEPRAEGTSLTPVKPRPVSRSPVRNTSLMPPELMLDRRPHLWNVPSSDLPVLSQIDRLKNTKFWPRWPNFSKLKRTG